MDDEELFRIVEWRVENFSCWNGEIHDKVIKSPETWYHPKFRVNLFPKGRSGNDEHMIVHICCSKSTNLLGELSYIGSDASLLHTQQVELHNGKVLELPPGPKFKEVVTQITESEALHKDILTLRLRCRNIKKSVEYIHTKIDAIRTTLKMSSLILDHLKEGHSLDIWINYEAGRDLFLTFSILESSKMELSLQPGEFKKNISVFTHMTVLNNEDVVRKEENQHLFLDANEWKFSTSLTKEEVKKKGFSLILCIGIVLGNKLKHSVLYHSGSFPPSAILLMPSKRFRPPSTSVPQECLSKDFMCLYQDQDFSDFQLKCGDVSIPVHKNILSARSPVFKTMLSTDMREAASGCMDIVDLDPSTLGLFLTYLYTGAVKELQGESALKLYYAADKYQVPSLKRECVSVLCSSVSISNVCDVLSLADKHQDDRLTSAAHDFILKNYNEVLKSKEWISFMKSEPLLAVETLTHFAQKNRVGKRKRSLS